MRFPKMREGAQYRVTVPALNGGVNLKDAPNLVEDNQLTDVKNMWWKDQALRTRPGLYTDENSIYTVSDNSKTIIGIKDLKGQRREGWEMFEEDYFRSATEVGFSSTSNTYWASIRRIFYSGKRDIPWDDSIGGNSSEPVTALYIDLIGNSAVSNYLVDKLSYSPEGMILYSSGEIYCTPRRFDEQFIDMKPYLYAPLVLVNGIGATSINNAAVTGTLYEGYNLLTPKFRARYTTDGKGIYFFLPEKKLDNTEIKGSFTMNNGQIFDFTIPANSSVSTQSVSGISVEISRSGGYFWFKNSSGPIASPSAGFSSNVEITVEKSKVCDRTKICEMKFYTWFGGDTNGINGGTRIFMSGHKWNSNLVHWSDVNNPLYFPENNYAYIGEADNPVTAFGKQADMLVIFKECELYYASYMAGPSYTAQDVIDGKVVDVAANAARFPITQISSHVGCDCPNTVQLCNNRLVWATTEGKVFVLATANQYNERNAYEISGMIRPDLLQIPKDGWSNASAGNFSNHYVLLIDDKMYVFDYGSSAFVNASAYSRDENLQKNICWYKWDMGIEGIRFTHFMARDTRGILLGEFSKENRKYNAIFSLKGRDDIIPRFVGDTHNIEYIHRPVPACFQTKTFDFGRPDRRKFIRRLHIGATDTEEKYISLSYITEDGVQADAYRIGVHGDGKMREWSITPGVSRVRQFGIRAESSGNMAVDNMVLKYEVNGEVR